MNVFPFKNKNQGWTDRREHRMTGSDQCARTERTTDLVVSRPFDGRDNVEVPCNDNLIVRWNSFHERGQCSLFSVSEGYVGA